MDACKRSGSLCFFSKLLFKTKVSTRVKYFTRPRHQAIAQTKYSARQTSTSKMMRTGKSLTEKRVVTSTSLRHLKRVQGNLGATILSSEERYVARRGGKARIPSKLRAFSSPTSIRRVAWLLTLPGNVTPQKPCLPLWISRQKKSGSSRTTTLVTCVT